MLHKSNFSIKAAVANCSGAIEADTISKNGRSLKSQMSKENIGRKLVCLFALIWTFSFTSFAQQYDSENDFEVIQVMSNAAISKYKGNKQKVNIPPEIQGMSVSTIGSGVFANKDLISINLPSSVRFLEKGAFYNNYLASITLPNVINIRADVFNYNELTSVTIPKVMHITATAFHNNPITKITIGSNVQFHTYGEDGVTYNTAFDNGFDAFYISQGRLAGTYTYSNGRWSFVGQ